MMQIVRSSQNKVCRKNKDNSNEQVVPTEKYIALALFALALARVLIFHRMEKTKARQSWVPAPIRHRTTYIMREMELLVGTALFLVQ